MCALIYRVSDMQMFLREDGIFSSGPNDGDEVIDLSEAPDLLGVEYVGSHIRQLAQFRSGGLPYYEEPSYKALKEASDLVTFGSSLFELFTELNNWLSHAPPPKDPALVLLAQLNAKMQAIEDFQLASWVTSREQHLATLRAYSHTAIVAAREYAEVWWNWHGDGEPLDEPYWANVIHSALHDSALAVSELMQPASWMRPQSLAAISNKGDPTPYPKGWMTNLPDRAEADGLFRVWDYRWALPALTYAIAARIIALKARYSPGALPGIPAVAAELEGYAQYLGEIWKRMNAGIRRGLSYATWPHRQYSDFVNNGWVPAFVVDLNGGEWVGGVAFWPDLDNRNLWWWNGQLPPTEYIPSGVGLGTEQWVAKFVTLIQHWGFGHLQEATGMGELMMFIGDIWNLHDGYYRSAPFNTWQRSIDDITSDEDLRKDAITAAFLSDVDPTLRLSEKDSNAFYIYSALRSHRGEAEKSVEQCAEDLIRMGRSLQVGDSRRRPGSPTCDRITSGAARRTA
ncbi:hypothetical protein RIU97_02630 [Streptomyces sp. 147326]